MYVCRIAIALVAVALLAAPGFATESDPLEPRVAVGKVVSPDGSLLARAKLDKGFQFLDKDETVFSRDTLLALPGIQGALQSETKGVRLTLWGNLRQMSAFAGLQSAVVLHDSRAFDLDFTLLRGRVVVANTNKKGPAQVWVRLSSEAWQITLPNPGDEVALEKFGRWPAGTDFSRTPRPGYGPASSVMLVVLKGQADLQTASMTFGMTAPPGPAYFFWDSTGGAIGGPRRGDKLPDWADPKAVVPAESVRIAAARTAFDRARKDRSPADALLHLLADDDKDADLQREIAVFGLAAVDEVLRVAEGLADPKHAEVREAAVTALRHWIGDEPGRDAQLYAVLTFALRYPPAQAETVMNLLHSPFAADQAESYETLLAYLRHEKPAVRELARWHLLRLVPAGRDIRFDPTDTGENRAKGVAAWKKLLVEKMLLSKDK